MLLEEHFLPNECQRGTPDQIRRLEPQTSLDSRSPTSSQVRAEACKGKIPGPCGPVLSLVGRDEDTALQFFSEASVSRDSPLLASDWAGRRLVVAHGRQPAAQWLSPVPRPQGTLGGCSSCNGGPVQPLLSFWVPLPQTSQASQGPYLLYCGQRPPVSTQRDDSLCSAHCGTYISAL